MQARDVMTTQVVTVKPHTTVPEIAKRLINRRISAVPVVDDAGRVVGIVSEGDLTRRKESGTARRVSWWLALMASPDIPMAPMPRASEMVYVHANTVSASKPAATIARSRLRTASSITSPTSAAS